MLISSTGNRGFCVFSRTADWWSDKGKVTGCRL